MRTKTKTLALAMTTVLMASGAVLAQDRPPAMDINAPPVAPVGPVLPGITCTGAGGTNCVMTAPPDFDSTLPIANCATVRDVEVGVDASADFSGDIQLTLTNPDGGTSVLMVPGGDGAGCDTADMYTILDDDSGVLVTTFCSGTPPGIDGVLKPANPLTAFDGKLGTGTWTLSVHDDFQLFDDITLNDWSLSLVCDTDADLSITKTAPAAATAGTQMTYSITAFNDGPAGVTQMVVTDTLPAGTTYVSDTDNCARAGQVLTCDLGAVPAGGDVTFDVTVMVAQSVSTGTVLTNTATVSSEVNDPRGSNDTATAATTVSRLAAITLTKTQTSANPIVAGSSGNNLCYNVRVQNAGPSNVTGLAISDSYTPWTGVSPVGPNWTINLAAGAIRNLPFCLTVASSAPEGTLRNTATVTGSAGGEDLGNPANHTDFVDTFINRVVDIRVTKTESIDPVVAGGGNLVYVVTVANFGPSNVTDLVITDVITVPANVSYSVFVNNGSWNDPNWTQSLSDNGSARLTVTVTAPLAAAEGTNVISDTASVTGSGGGEQIINPGNDSASQSTSIRWPEATFNVVKQYNGGTGASVNVALDCSDSTGLGVGAPASGATDTALVWRRFDHNTGTTCSVVETVPVGFFEIQRTADCDVSAVADGAVYNCTLTNAETVARFHVTKIFSDDSMDDVEVTLSCDTGLPLIQSLTIAGGDPTGVTFVVTDFVDGTMSCAVTEVTNTEGYTLEKSGCAWNNVMSIDSPFSCVVNNEAQDATFTANKEWDIIGTGGEVVNTRTPVTIFCDSEITTAGAVGSGQFWSLRGVLDDGEFLTATVKTTTGAATCWATEAINDSAVEATDDCARPTTPNLVAGGSDSCTFFNTVFFEGIPTLSQYGLAILALLMLGVGMVGFRRFS